MKTTKSKSEASAPANVRPSNSVSKTDKSENEVEAKARDLAKRAENRSLPTETILNYLRTRLPKQFEMAELLRFA